MTKPASLRSSLVRVMLLLGFLAVIATSALIVLTTILHRTTLNAAAATDSVRLAAEAQVDLLLHERATDPLVRREIEGDLRRRLAAARSLVTTDAEVMVLDRSDARVGDYVASAEEPHDARTAQLHQQAYAALDELVSLNVEQASEARAVATRLDDLANVLGVAVSLLLVAIAGGLALWLRGRAFAPIFGLAEVMRRFGRGERDVRAEERGPAELREMSARFNEMAAAIAAQRQAQIAFLGGVAHDLRNPLSVLQLAVALIRDDQPLPPEDKLRKTIGRIRGQIVRMDRMIGDFLDMAKIEAGELDLRLQVHDARDLVRDVVGLFDSGATTSRIEMRLPDEAVPLRCDALRIEQVVTNLVSNAIKYSPPDSPIAITLGQDEEQVVIGVEDRGFGIGEGDRERVFEPFRRVGASKDSAPGAGLGLFVVRRIVEAHGGRIDVQSAPGRGSTFEVWLPRTSKGTARQGATRASAD